MPSPYEQWQMGPPQPGSTNSLAFGASAIPMGNFVNTQFNQIAQNPFGYYNGGGNYTLQGGYGAPPMMPPPQYYGPPQGYMPQPYYPQPMYPQPAFQQPPAAAPAADTGFLGSMINTIGEGLRQIKPVVYSLGGFSNAWGEGGAGLNGSTIGGGAGAYGAANPYQQGYGQNPYANQAYPAGYNQGYGAGYGDDMTGPLYAYMPTDVEMQVDINTPEDYMALMGMMEANGGSLDPNQLMMMAQAQQMDPNAMDLNSIMGMMGNITDPAMLAELMSGIQEIMNLQTQLTTVNGYNTTNATTTQQNMIRRAVVRQGPSTTTKRTQTHTYTIPGVTVWPSPTPIVMTVVPTVWPSPTPIVMTVLPTVWPSPTPVVAIAKIAVAKVDAV